MGPVFREALFFLDKQTFLMPTTAEPAIRELVKVGTPVIGYIYKDENVTLVASFVLGTGIVAVEALDQHGLSTNLLPEHSAIAGWVVDLLDPVTV